MKPIVFCLTPIKNEAWILERFLTATSLWADHIIIADQMSTDGSREIAQKFSKVVLIENNSDEYNEPERQKLLINEARKIEGHKLLIAIDADEMFTPNILWSEEWKNALSAKPGTLIKFQWANLKPDFKTMWYGDYFPWGYMDDGQEHTENNKIHSGRIPMPQNSINLELKDIKLMHFQYTNWKRMESKHNWYQCYERVLYPHRSAVDIFRGYHHMYSLKKEQILQLPIEWINDYENLGINIVSKVNEDKIWFDEKTLDLMDEYGVTYFKNIAIWKRDWQKIAKTYKRLNFKHYKDPRTILDKIIQIWFWRTQSVFQEKYYSKVDRRIKRIYNY
jgi:hypothetical protein